MRDAIASLEIEHPAVPARRLTVSPTRVCTNGPGMSPSNVHAATVVSSAMRMFACFGTALDTNRRFYELLASGSAGLSTAYDLPTPTGRHSDAALALGVMPVLARDGTCDRACLARPPIPRSANILAIPQS